MALKIDATLDRKLTCAFENIMRNLGNFHENTEKSKNWNLMGSFYPKQKMYELKIYRGDFCYDSEE